jgi:hypothetical protein
MLIIAGIMTLVFYSCKDNPTLVGANLLKNDYINVKQLDSYSDTLHQTSSYYKKVIPLGASGTLLVGNAANVQASTLILYAISLPDSIITDLNNNAVNIVSSTIHLTPTYTFGDSTASFDFSVHKVNSSWTSLGFDADSLPGLVYDQTDLSLNHQFSDTLVTVDVSNSSVTTWLKEVADSTYSSDHGIYLMPNSNAKKVVGFRAYTAGTTPGTSLHIVLQKPGAYSDTLIFYPLQDVSIVTGNLPTAVKGDMFIQSSVTINSKIWFDVSSIPKNALINNAELTLTRDSVSTITGNSYTNTLLVYLLADSTNESLSDSTQILTLTGSGNVFQGNITPFIQSWVDKGNNQGLLIKAASQIGGLELFAIKNSSAANLSVRPRLQITYTINK